MPAGIYSKSAIGTTVAVSIDGAYVEIDGLAERANPERRK